MKLYTNTTCHYCNRIKEALDAAQIEYTEVITNDNFEEWNDLLRITGLAVTPSIVFQEEIWIPNRDFRTPEELVARLQHFINHPMPVLKLEDRVDQLHNSVKNLALLLNQMSQTLSQVNQQTAGTPNNVNNPQGQNPQPPQSPQQPQQPPQPQQPQHPQQPPIKPDGSVQPKSEPFVNY